MWNSPNRASENGKRYTVADISALTFPLDEMLDLLGSMPVKDIAHEAILKRLERNEFVYALYQFLEALLEDVPIPSKGHTGVQEAIVAELLDQSFTKICCELDDSEPGHWARKAVWNSVDRLLIQHDSSKPELPWMLERVGLELSCPQPYLSEKLTQDAWQELLLSDGGLWDEFLWDTDWRIDSLMDLPPDTAGSVTKTMGLDLGVVQALPHTPSDPEAQMAEHYIRYVMWKDAVIQQDSDANGADSADTAES